MISPENCSTILWRSWDYKEQAADALKLTANDMINHNLIDEIITEPIGGAHTLPKEAIKNVKKSIKINIEICEKINTTRLIQMRMKKFSNMGHYKE